MKTFQVDPNEKMGLGKELLVGYRLPIVGDYIFSATVTRFVDGKYVYLRTSVSLTILELIFQEDSI